MRKIHLTSELVDLEIKFSTLIPLSTKENIIKSLNENETLTIVYSLKK